MGATALVAGVECIAVGKHACVACTSTGSAGACPSSSLNPLYLGPPTDFSSIDQDYNMHSFHFDDQYNTFHSYGYAVAPGGQAIVGDPHGFGEHKGALYVKVDAKQSLAWSNVVGRGWPKAAVLIGSGVYLALL